jgi:hypothetical protein
MRVRSAIAIAAVAVSILLVALASAGAAPSATTSEPVAAPEATAAVVSSPSAEATRVYDLDFTLPTAGKSGCLVCHGDPNLAKVGAETTSSIYVDVDRLRQSAHAEGVPCTGCHLNFAYTVPHEQVKLDENWVGSARLACKNCHTEEFSEYASGAHSLAGDPGSSPTETIAARKAEGKPERAPNCGDCHGGHEIPSSDDEDAQRVLHRSGLEMCGSCHVRESDSYNDYYHGAAYRRGSLDAPSCWDCHGYHEVLPSDDINSPVHKNQLVLTCGQPGCHAGADERFLEYATLIHGQRELYEANPVASVVIKAKSAVRGVFDAVASLF